VGGWRAGEGGLGVDAERGIGRREQRLFEGKLFPERGRGGMDNGRIKSQSGNTTKPTAGKQVK